LTNNSESAELHNLYSSLPDVKSLKLEALEYTWDELAERNLTKRRGILEIGWLFSYDFNKYCKKNIDHEYFTVVIDLLEEISGVTHFPMQLEFNADDFPKTESPKLDADPGKPKKRNVKEELDDDKMKKQWVAELKTALEPFTPKERLTAINQGLGNLIQFDDSLKLRDADVDFNNYMILSLLDMGDALLSQNSPFKEKERKQHFEDEKTSLKNKEFLVEDIHRFGNYIFQKKQWSKLNLISQYIQAMPAHEYILISNILRMACANMLLATHNEKKVSFVANTDVKSYIKTPKLEPTEEIATAATILCKAVLLGVQNEQMLFEHTEILLDSMNFLWILLEPYVRDIQPHKQFHLKSPFLLLFQFLNSAYSTIPFFKDINLFLQAIGLSKKLANIFRMREAYELSGNVLKDCLKSIEHALDKMIGSCGDKISLITTDLLFHKDRIEAIGCSKNELIKKLSCIHVDIYCDFYQSEIKRMKANELREVAFLQASETKLRHKYITVGRICQFKDESTIKLYCGYDPTKRALYLMSVALHETLSPEESYIFLKKASDYLIQAREAEFLVFDQTKISKSLGTDILHKTSTSLTIKIPQFDGKNSGFQIIGQVGNSSTDMCGVGIIFPYSNSTETSFTVFGLPRNEKIILKLIMNSNDTKTIFSTLKIYSSIPMSILLCWTYLAVISDVKIVPDIYNLSLDTLESHFRLSRIPTESLRQPVNESQIQPFYIDKTHISDCNVAVIRGFIQCIFLSIENRTKEFNISSNSNSVHALQVLILTNSLNYMICAESAKLNGGSKLELLCSIKSFEELKPLIENNSDMPFVIYLLIRCHESIMRNASEFANDQSKGIRYYLVPIAYYLIQKFIQLGEHSMAAKIAYDTISIITLTSYSADVKILNSNAVESNLLGYLYRPYKGKGKRNSTILLQDHGFHNRIAITKNVHTGLTLQAKPFDLFYEKIEMFLVQNKILLPSNSSDPNSKKGFTSKKYLDSFTTLRDIYLLFLVNGVEMTLTELGKFKKNARYIEILVHLITWCLEKDYLDYVIKVSNEIDEFMDKRAQAILRCDELLLDLVQLKKDILVKRRKRILFTITNRYITINIVEPRASSRNHDQILQPG
jgi:hypothetical protein